MQTDLAKLEEIFKRMSADGFDTSGPLRWGFYFFDNDRSKLSKVYEELKSTGYSLETIEEVHGHWRLFVSKIDILSAEKLHKRNIAFNQLADYCDVELYDGWDVEKVK